MLKYLLLILIVYSCSDIASPEIKEEEDIFEDVYHMNLRGINTGSSFDISTIKWTQYENNDFDSYSINNQTNSIHTNIYNNEDTEYDIALEPAQFEIMTVEILNSNEQQLETSSIEIYTRPIKSVTNFTVAANSDNWFTTLEWNPTQEISNSFKQYEIQRHQIINNNDNDTSELYQFETIDIISNQNISSYIDSSTIWGYEYCYRIKTETIEGYNRYSVIQSNIESNIFNQQIIIDSIISNQNNKITIYWSHNLNNNEDLYNQQEFYALEIWRTDEENQDPLNDYLLTTITDYDKKNMRDSYLIGNGISWFYKLKIIDQYGNSAYSLIESGNSHP